MIALPQPDVTDVPLNRLNRYQYLMRLKQEFWSRWSREYLATLRRTKWKELRSEDLKIGTMVILKDENSPPRCWKLGRIATVYLGRDKLIRTVDVQTSQGLYKRNITKICVLPMESSE